MHRGNQNKPYLKLGNRLKLIREQQRQSLAEAAGAVEIDSTTLEKIESGYGRPTQEILLLLISHFDLSDKQSDQLWDLAGYDNNKGVPMEDSVTSQTTIMVLPMDARIVYTDSVNIQVNSYGVVMNFMQKTMQSAQPIAISRVGMSLEHARSVVNVLNETLNQATRFQASKSLPAPKQPKDSK